MGAIFVDMGEREDDAYDEHRQCQVDEGKRRASGTSPELLSIQDAHAEGARVGCRGSSRSLNPFQDHTPEHEAWNRGWDAANAQRFARMVA